MNSFFFKINGWAGHVAWLDAVARAYYICAVPLLATGLAGIVLLAPVRMVAAPRRRIALVAIGAGCFCFLIVGAFNLAAVQYFHCPVIAPRPNMSNYVTLLVSEPNDNSFPCIEVMLAACLALGLWMTSRAAGLTGGALVFAFCLTRVLCGTTYIEDALASWALGGACGQAALALCGAGVAVSGGGRRDRRRAIFGCLALLGLTSAVVLSAPRYRERIASLRHSAPEMVETVRFQRFPDAAAQGGQRPPDRVPEGTTTDSAGTADEGVSATKPLHAPEVSWKAASMIAPQATAQRGFDPAAQFYLARAMSRLHPPLPLGGLEVAQLGHDSRGGAIYRCALIRFTVRQGDPAARAHAMLTASAVVRAAFQSDAQLRHVDVVGSLPGDRYHDETSNELPREPPAFTVSVERDRFSPAESAAGCAGAANCQAWLRARSRIYIDDAVLPSDPTASPRPHLPASAAAGFPVVPQAIARPRSY